MPKWVGVITCFFKGCDLRFEGAYDHPDWTMHRWSCPRCGWANWGKTGQAIASPPPAVRASERGGEARREEGR